MRTVTGFLAAGACFGTLASPALAVDTATCTAGSAEPHAGRPFKVAAQTSPIIGNFTYDWDFGADGSFERTTTDGAVEVEEPRAGTYAFAVRVTDNDVDAGGSGREFTATCSVRVINDPPFPIFEMQAYGSQPVPYEAVRFVYTSTDSEDQLNEQLVKQAVDFDGDGTFDYTSEGRDGEVFVSFPAGFDKTVLHRVTDSAGASVDTQVHVKVAGNKGGVGGTAVVVPVGQGAAEKVTANAPKSISRKALLQGSLAATFNWGNVSAFAAMTPVVRRGRKSVKGVEVGDSLRFAPGERVPLKQLVPDAAALVRHGADRIELRWRVVSDGPDRTGKLNVRIKD